MNQTEDELEKFRQAWRDEVSRRGPQPGESRAEQSSSTKGRQRQAKNPKSMAGPTGHQDTEIEPHTYHDVEEKESGRRVGDGPPLVGEPADPPPPMTALEHYERAVEREGQGNLGESLAHYRKAFKAGASLLSPANADDSQLDPRVQEKYKAKHVAVQAQGKAPQPATATAQHTLSTLSQSVSDLIDGFVGLEIVGQEPPTDLSPEPPCPISKIPDEILLEILLTAAVTDVASYARLAQVCKRLAYLVFKEDRIWRRIALGHEHGFAAMHYGFACSIQGSFLSEGVGLINAVELLDIPYQVPLLLTDQYPTYRQMFRSRPRIRFHGCYISTVNYTRPGATVFNTVSWNAPVLIVTYFRYLRFFRDGTVISLLTTAEPADVVPYLHKEHVHGHHQAGSNLPQTVMKEALRGRWRLTGDPYGTKLQQKTLLGEVDDDETEGELIVETEGVVPKYTYKMSLAFGSAGRGARNNKLSWKGFWSYNKLTDDWGEFGRKNYRPFVWSRVRSYGNGL